MSALPCLTYPSFTSWRREPGGAPDPLTVGYMTVLRRPSGSRRLAALLAARGMLVASSWSCPPSRSCHPLGRGRRVRAREASAQRLGLDSVELGRDHRAARRTSPSLEGRWCRNRPARSDIRLAGDAPSVHPSVAMSKLVGVGGGCHASDGAILEAQASWLPANPGGSFPAWVPPLGS